MGFLVMSSLVTGSLSLLGEPALPLDEAGKYVAGAYVVFLALLVLYVAIMATRLGRIQDEIRKLADASEGKGPAPAEPVTEARAMASDPDKDKTPA